MVTFLFTDIEGSTRLWQQQPEVMRELLARHDALLRHTIGQGGGSVFKMMGDACYARFNSSEGAVHAAVAGQRLLQRELPELRVRMALHAGEAEERDGDYFGPALNHLARLLAAGHGGQILLSGPVADATRHLLPAPTRLRPLGTHRLRDIEDTETIFQLQPPGLPARFPPLNTLNVAFRRGLVRAGAIGAVVVALVTSLALVAVEQRNQLRTQKETIRRNLYDAEMSVAERAVETGNLQRAAMLLDAHRPKPGEQDLREFTWRYLWRASRDQSSFTLDTRDPRLRAMTLSPDQRTLAATTQDGRIRLWDVTARREVATWQGHAGRINFVAFDPAGRRLATCGADGTVRLWDVRRHVQTAVLRMQSPSPATRPTGRPFARNFIECLAFSPDGCTLVSAGEDGMVRLWNTSTRKQVAALADPSPALYLTFSPDGRTLASSYSTGESVRLWDIASRRQTAAFSRQGQDSQLISCLVFAPDGKRLAWSGRNGFVRLWDLAGRRLIPSAMRHPAWIMSLQFSPDSRTLATVGDDACLRLWNVTTREARGVFRGHSGAVWDVEFVDGGRTLVTIARDGLIKYWDAIPPPLNRLYDPGLQPTGLVFSPDDRILASWGVSQGVGRTRLWDVPLQRPVGPAEPGDRVRSLAFSPHGELAAGRPDGTVALYDAHEAAEGRLTDPRRVLRGRRGSLSQLWFTAGGSRDLARADSPGKAEAEFGLWDVARDQLLTRVITETKGSITVAFSEASGILAAGLDGRIRFWRFPVGQEGSSRNVIDYRPGSAAYSPDGRVLAIGNGRGEISLVDVASRREVRTLSGHQSYVRVIAFSPDSRTLATGGDDKTVRLWNLTDGRELCELAGNDQGVVSVAFSPDGNTLAAGTRSGAIRLRPAATFTKTDRTVRTVPSPR